MLLSRLWARRAPPSKPSLPPGHRLYVIGDIHGRSDLLAPLLAAVADDVRVDPAAEPLIVSLGDYCDRGLGSAQVLDLLTGPLPAPLVALRGNHEQMLLDFLEDAAVLDSWRRFGGAETLFSYGVDVREVQHGRGLEAAQGAFRAQMPAAHLAFLQSTAPSFTLGDYFFCHAGVRPGTPLEQQQPADLLWIRDEFLNSAAAHGKIVVHGHTPTPSPEFRANRINLDTGAYASGSLTCLRLQDADRHILSATPEGARWRPA